MRYITIPTPDAILVKTGNLDQEMKNIMRKVTFFDFIADNIATDSKQMGDTIRDTRRNIMLLGLFESKKSGDVIAIEDADWTKMNNVCEKPTGGWNQFFVMQLISFVDAIMAYDEKTNPTGAREKDPRVVEPEVPAEPEA